MTRLYPITSGATTVPLPVADAGWTVTAAGFATTVYLSKWRGTALAETNIASRSYGESSASVHNIGMFRLVTQPLSAQTIAGYVKMRFLAAESSAAADMRSQAVIKVISADGATVRGTLLSMDDSATVAPEFISDAVYQGSTRFPHGWTDPGAALSPVAAQDGDRILIEVGARALNTSTTTYTARMNMSDSRGIADIESSDGVVAVVNALRMPLIEFSQDLWPAEPVFTEQPAAVWVRDVIHKDFYSSHGTALAITVPSVQAGDLVVATLRHSNARTVSISGLGATWQTAQSDASDLGLHIFVGTSGVSGTVTFTLNSNDVALFASVYVIAGASAAYQVAYDGGTASLARSVSLPVPAGGIALGVAVGRDGVGDWGSGFVGPDIDDWLVMPSRASGPVNGPVGVRRFATAGTATASYGTDGTVKARRTFLAVFSPNTTAYRGWGVSL